MGWSNPRLYGAFVGVLALISVGSVPAYGVETVSEAIVTGSSADVVMLIAFVLLALCFSFICSVAEAVLLSITPSYIEGLREKHPKRAELLKRLRHDRIDQSLAAILTLNTIAHTVGAILAGAQAAVVFGSSLIGVFSAVMTLMILFLSEIVPKTIGAVYWQKFTGATARFVHGLIIILYPFVWVSEGLTGLIARGKTGHVFSREEFIAMAGIGEKTGHIAEREFRIIRNLFRFGALKASDIMTPRTVIAALPQEMMLSEALEKATRTPFSRLPVYGTDIDDITGFVLRDEMMIFKSRNQEDVNLEALKRDILAVPESKSLSSLLELLLDRRQHIVIVVDEYGGTRGLVTLEDVLETLLGMEIVDEVDSVVDMQVLARQLWAKRARALGVDVGIADQNQTKHL